MKVNAEKGDGPEIAKRYGIRGFPTLLLVGSDGEEIDRIIGFRRPEPLLEELRAILSGDSYAALKKKVAENPKDFDAAIALGKRYEVRNRYDEAIALYRRVAEDPAATDAQKAIADARISIAVFFESRDEETLEKLEKYFQEHKKTDYVADHAEILFFHNQRSGDPKKVIEAAEYLLAHGRDEDASFLNNYAWYLATNDKKLEEALRLAKKAVELEPKAAHIVDTLAEAYFRNGLKEEAVKAQKRAVELAPENQRTELEKRLKKFEEALEEERDGEEP